MRICRLALISVLFLDLASAQGRHTARSMVVSEYGIVATTHVQASQAGAEILRKGGSAVDAAIAANAVLGVTEPMMNGIGGDLFAIYWDAKSGKLYGLNSSGWAPQGLTLEHMKAKGASKMPLRSIDTVTVPGAVAGWYALHDRFGKLAWKDLFGPAIFYTSQGLGGTMSAADLADFKPEWVEPISTTYRGWTVYELPPNGQGMAALEMLNIMETSPASPEGALSVSELHKKIEAMKLAYADLERYNADPRFAKVPVNGLLSKEYAKERAQLINPDHANCKVSYGTPHGDTTYLTAVDREGNIVSLIQSNFEGFGSGIVVRGMGFVLQDRGALFSLDPNSPNVLAPHKRPFHTIIPAFMQRGDQHIGFGIMGGANQPLAHAQFVSNIADYGMNVQEALENARFTVSPERGCDIYIESRVAPEVRNKLTAMGHKLHVDREYSPRMGRGNAVLHDSQTNVNYGGSDARADGSAEAEPPPAWK
jgi:gamma-glutamyltranspeptidase